MKLLFLFVAVFFLTGNLIVINAQQQLNIPKSELFPLSIIHINDFHARYEPTDTSGGACEASEECIGGYARTVYTVRQLLEQQKDNNVLYFNAGDSFQGTLWYNVGRWNVTSQFLNLLPADAMTLGNHEFDHGVEGVVPFLEALDSPMLVANIDATNEPTMEGKYQPSIIIERSGRKIGVIGIILETTYDLANTGKLIFRNESETILEEAAKLKAQGANIIIVLSHCGYDVDKVIAQVAGSEIDVIVGSHSHTFLYTGDTPPGFPDTPRGDYPTVVTHTPSGHRVLIVQAGAYAKYVGNLTVYFDDEGNVVDYAGDPIYMSNDVPQDSKTLEAMEPWKDYIDMRGNVVIGESLVDLPQQPCDSRECKLGNFVTDAMVNAFKTVKRNPKSWRDVAIGLVNNRAMKSSLHKGNLTYSQLIAMLPFENPLVAFDLPAKYLREALEYSVSSIDLNKGVNSSYNMLQVSGIRVTYDLQQPAFQRIIDLKIRCAQCVQPKYQEFDQNSVYRLVTPQFLKNGGNGYTMFRDFGTNVRLYIRDIDAIMEYTQKFSPISPTIEGHSEVLKVMPLWKDIVETQGSVKIGETKVNLESNACGYKECNMGNFYTDATLYKLMHLVPYTLNDWTNVSISVVAAGELYMDWPKGDITYAQVYSMAPYEAPLVAFDLQGVYLRAALEKSVSRLDNITYNSTTSFLQVSGLKIVYNLRNPVNERVVDVKVRCAACKVPKFEDLNDDAVYRMIATRYVATGGYGFSIFEDYGQNFVEYATEYESLMEYVDKFSPLYTGLENPLDVIEAMEPWKLILDEQIAEIIGETKVDLLKSDCDRTECNIGNFFADAAVYAFAKLTAYNECYWSQASIALINTGAIRVPLSKGNLSYGHLSTMSPFENKMTAFTLAGSELLNALEFSLNEIDLDADKTTSSIFLQVSGLKITYNITRPFGQRVQQVKVRCQNCDVPKFIPLDVNEEYRIITSDFIAEGGGGFTMFRDYGKDLQKELTDIEAVCDYVKDNTPVTTGLEGRIKIVY
ncbi:apyrase-like [Musca autumnalis]|uniref:apyrase-like n=1 Tax=Musca autumnalis TaxID=221902 RepID=UPI003CE70997